MDFILVRGKPRVSHFNVACRALALGLGGSIWLALPDLAELKWEQSTFELQPSVGDTQAVAHFMYHKNGTTPVHWVRNEFETQNWEKEVPIARIDLGA